MQDNSRNGPSADENPCEVEALNREEQRPHPRLGPTLRNLIARFCTVDGAPVRKAVAVPQTQSALHITIGTGPLSDNDGRLTLSHDLALLNVGLLYGDRIKFCSIGGSMIAVVSQIGLLTEAQRLDAMRSWVILAAGNDPTAGQAFDTVKSLRRRQHRSREELLLLRKLSESINRVWDDVQSMVVKIAHEAGIDGIADALNTGLVELDIYPTDTDEAVKAFFRSVSDAIVSADSYPLFDDQTGTLVGAAVREGLIPTDAPDEHKARVAGLAADVLQRLPLFDQASIEEILAIRRELDRALIRFRSAMISYSTMIESASWDRTFSTEAELLFRREVEPAVLDIEEEVRANTLVRTIMRRAPEAILVPASSSALGLLISTAAGFSSILGSAAAYAVGAGLLAKAVAEQRAERQQRLEQNKLFFYYGAQHRLQAR